MKRHVVDNHSSARASWQVLNSWQVGDPRIFIFYHVDHVFGSWSFPPFQPGDTRAKIALDASLLPTTRKAELAVIEQSLPY